MNNLVYLDWNVFNAIEQMDIQESPEKPEFKRIRSLIESNQIIVPYSNAHINDLLRGYLKDSAYTPGHLSNITRLTGNLCLTQYWGESQVKWHYRDPEQYLEDTIEQHGSEASSFSTLFQSLDDPLMDLAFELRKSALRLMPVPESFRKIYSFNPIFNSMYPRTKIEMNHLALCEDLFDFSHKIKTDFTLYKHFRKFLLESKAKFPMYKDTFNNAESKLIGQPEYLTWDAMWDEIKPVTKTSENLAYSKIMGLFTTTDLKGYRMDERFANLIDDALHCFYAAHCDYFVTLDKRCYDKSKLVYQKLKIKTQVLTPVEYSILMT